MKRGDFPQATNEVNGKRELHPSRSMIEKYGGRIYAFRDLPIEAQLAAAHYMGVDGEAWDVSELGAFDGVKWSRYPQGDKEHARNEQLIVNGLTRCMSRIVEGYGNMEFGYVVVPAEALKQLWAEIDSDGARDFSIDGKPDFNAYHAWYQGLGNDQDSPTWPVILGSFKDELLQDGWHRFHAYVANGSAEIACLWYPEKGVGVYE